MPFNQWFWSHFRPDHRAYHEAYSLYEELAARIGLGLLGPTREQEEAARHEMALLAKIDAAYDVARLESLKARIPFNVACVIYQKALLSRLIGNYLATAGLLQEALGWFEASLQDRSPARQQISMCHFYLGQALLRMAKPDEACKHLELARSLDHALKDTARTEALEAMLSTARERMP